MWKLREYNKTVEKDFLNQNQGKLISRLLSQRNVNIETLNAFLSCDYEDLPHPHKLKGIEEASLIFCQMAKNKKRIAVFGDYDVDGIMSSVIMKELCNVFKLDCNVFLPSRNEHGYGLNKKSLIAFKDFLKEPVDLLVLVDCGSNNEREILELKEFGIKKIIIIDHHIISEDKMSKSADVLINWHLCDFWETCATGEVFQLIRGIRWLTKKVNPIEFLSYASIGILGDICPLNVYNRIIVKNGLKRTSLNYLTSNGLNALIKVSRINTNDLSSDDVSFRIGPRINAPGRISIPNVSYNLILEKNPSEAELMAEVVNEQNDQRKKIQSVVEKEAMEIVKKNLSEYEHGILIYRPHWHIGVLGIASSALVNKFYRPCILLGHNNDNDIIKGSGRSINGINLKEILDECQKNKNVFSNYGGHSMAVGVSIEESKIKDANKIFNHFCEQYYEKNFYPKKINYYDAELKAETLNIDTALLLSKKLAPYCNVENPEPVFLIKDVIISETKMKDDEKWRLLKFFGIKDNKQIEMQMLYFNKEIGTEINGQKYDIYFTFSQDPSKNEICVKDLIRKNS